uniref:Uncharacterized protein n=1 Tax=Eutreptiella gymnastica TaxID=73025 RepID=A0A7S1NC88_9EUGL
MAGAWVMQNAFRAGYWVTGLNKVHARHRKMAESGHPRAKWALSAANMQANTPTIALARARREKNEGVRGVESMSSVLNVFPTHVSFLASLLCVGAEKVQGQAQGRCTRRIIFTP